MSFTPIRLFLVLSAILIAASAWRLTVSYGKADSYEKLSVNSERVETDDDIQPVMHDTQPLPKIHVRATLLPRQGESTALLVIDHQPATWYRCGDRIYPGFILSAIGKMRVTVRDELHNAYYEYMLHSGKTSRSDTPITEMPSSLSQESSRITVGNDLSFKLINIMSWRNDA